MPQLKTANLNALNTYMRLNNITPTATYDFVKYPMFGFPLENPKDNATAWGFTVTTGTLSNAYGVPLMETPATGTVGGSVAATLSLSTTNP